ncbi:MAG TPA: class F sortase [Acidimicrobiales bacterium]|nr:class F sortase [Acidimicrobiales bacterium]
MSVSPTALTNLPSRVVTAVLGGAVALVLSGAMAALVQHREVPGSQFAVSSAAPGGRQSPSSPTSPSSIAEAAVVTPVRVDIPRIGVSAPVDSIGLHDDRTVAVPDTFDRTGWYSGLEAPGQVGTAIIVGHLDSHTGPAVFFRVPELGPGDEILVALADGTSVRFVVERAEQYRKQEFPTIAVYGPTDRPTLRLITCGGTFDKKSRHYRDNVVVYASAQEAT